MTKFQKIIISGFVAGVAGVSVALAFDFVLNFYWDSYYSNYPPEGYSTAWAKRIVRPGFYASAKGLLHAAALFLASGLSISVLWYRNAWYIAFPYIACAIISFSFLAFQDPAVLKGNLAPLTPLFIVIYIGPAFLLGVGVGSFCRFIGGRLHSYFREK